MAYGIKSLARKVTLELIYEAVDERTKDIKEDIAELKADVRSINSRLDQFQIRLEQLQTSNNARFDQIFTLLTQLIQQRNGK